MMKITIKAIALSIGLAVASGEIAFAQESGDAEQEIRYRARTEIDFEGVDVAGELVRPQGALLLDRKKGAFNPLIRLREEFNLEMEHSVNFIR
jgi:hypothetical protein